MKENIKNIQMGKKTMVDNAVLNVYQRGSGESTLVFLAGFGMCSPILSFKRLYSLLTDNFRIVVLEKPGYGFSDVSDSTKDLDTVINQYREALALREIHPPYILCACSISGLEALYWADKFPHEISAIVGLDMTFPRLMAEYKYSIPFLKLAGLFMRSGAGRLLPKMWKDETVKYGWLSQKDNQVYRKLFYKKALSRDMINEAKQLAENIKITQALALPTVPMLLFVSNGTETGIDKELYVKIYNEIISELENGNLENAQIIRFDCSHFLYLIKSDEIAGIIKGGTLLRRSHSI